MRSVSGGFLLLLSSLAGSAWGQSPTDKATAQALFDEAKRLLGEGKFGDACPKLAESQRLDPAPGTLLNLADCYEKSGMTASAWATWLEAAAVTHNAGQTDRERVARERAAALKPKLVTLTVAVTDANRPSGLSVQRDGASVGAATWGTPVPIDPGQHTVVAMAPGYRGWRTTVTVTAGGQPVVVTVPALEPSSAPSPVPALVAGAPAPNAPPVPASATPVAPGSNAPPVPASAPPIVPAAPAIAAPIQLAVAPVAAADKPPTTDSGPRHSSTQRTVAYVVGGIGIVGLGVGGVFAFQAKSKNDDSVAKCRSATICGPVGYGLRQDAKDAATYATIAVGAGTAALMTGVVLLLTAPAAPEPAKQARFRLVPALSPTDRALVAEGAF